MRLLKYVLFFIASILLIFFILIILFLYELPVYITNHEKSEICLVTVKLGAITYLENIQLKKYENVNFTDRTMLSEQLSISYYRGQCGNDNNPINLSCNLERLTGGFCDVYIAPGGIGCSGCYN